MEASHPVDEIWEAIESELDDESSRGDLLALYGDLLDEDGEMRSLRAEYGERCKQIGDHGELRDCERHVLIDKLDRAWREHLDALDVLREQSGFHRYAQKDPLLEFRRSAAIAYQERQQNLLSDISKSLFLGIERWHAGEAQRRLEESARTALAQQMAKSEEPRKPEIAASPKLSRNAPCPCGSGMKFKRCCMNKAS